MKLGLNLSFAVKRWMEPEILAKICKEEFNIEHIQFSWDFIDPWWSEKERNSIARQYRDAFNSFGLVIDSNFAGNAAYTFPHFLGPIKEQRNLALEYFKRAVDVSLELGTDIIGSPAGGMSNKVSYDSKLREEAYKELLEYLFVLAEYASESGIKEIQIEATPLETEFPHSPGASLKLMEDLSGSSIPYKLLIDWGHALFSPLLKEEADIDIWFEKCKKHIGGIHLQQTDGLYDRHWDFTNPNGIITPEKILEATKRSGLDDIYQYLEVVTAYEEKDEIVFKNMKKTMEFLHKNLGV